MKLNNNDLFSSIPKYKQFSEYSDIILQERQKEFDTYSQMFIKWATHLPTYNKVVPIINTIFGRCEQYLDTVFSARFPTKEEFSSRLWELFLCDFFLTRGFLLDSKFKKQGTPDFCILYNNTKIWIEASMPAEHSSVEKLGNGSYKIGEISTSRYLRLSNSFTTKSNKWNETYIKNGCKLNDPFIIAINGNSVDSWSTDKGILAILYGIGLTQIDINGNISYQNLQSINKGSELIDINYFSKTEFSHVSGVIYLESEIKPENNDLFVERNNFHFIPNIYAKNPVSEDFIKKLNIHIPVNFI